MKNHCAGFILYLLPLAAFGQIEWVGNHAFAETAKDIVRTPQGEFVILHSNGKGITVLSDQGELVFDTWFFGYEISDFLILPDTSYIFSVGLRYCDVIDGYVFKFDKNWEQAWSNQSFIAGSAVHLSNNLVVLASNSFIEWWSPDGSLLFERFYPNLELADLVATGNDSLLLMTNLGLYKLTWDGEIVDSFPGLLFDRLEHMPNGNFLALEDDALALYSPDFEQLARFQPSNSTTVNDFTFGKDELAVLTTVPEIIRLDFNLNHIGTTHLSGHNQTFEALVYAEAGFLVGGGEQFGTLGHSNQSAFVKSFLLDGSTSLSDTDVALTAVYQSGSIEAMQDEGLISVNIPNISLLVENSGSVPIDRVNVNFMRPTVGLFPCPIGQSISLPFGNLKLQPGESALLQWGEMELYSWEDISAAAIELCFWTSLPDHLLETNNDNDVHCTEVLVDNHGPFPLYFSHSFLPGAGLLNLNMQSAVDYAAAQARIFNAAGQLVFRAAITEQYQAFDLHSLANGVYFLQIVDGERAGWEKFAKY